MPTDAQHEMKARRNERIAAEFHVTDAAEVEWAVTIIFYAALHWLEAYFDHTAGLHHQTHAQRHASAAVLPIYVDYRHLELASRRARYDVLPFTMAELNALMGHYHAVRDFVLATLYSSGTT